MKNIFIWIYTATSIGLAMMMVIWTLIKMRKGVGYGKRDKEG